MKRSCASSSESCLELEKLHKIDLTLSLGYNEVIRAVSSRIKCFIDVCYPHFADIVFKLFILSCGCLRCSALM